MALVLIWVTVAAGLVLSRIGEWRVHRRNYKMLRAAGADERAIWLSRGYYLIQWLVIPAALIEQLKLGTAIDRPMLVAGLSAITLALGLRFWAIYSLGSLWTMRCLALPGLRLLNAGPYRWLDGPEYLSRLIDGFGLCLIFGAKITAVVYLILATLMSRRLSVCEQRQWRAVDLRAGFS